MTERITPHAWTAGHAWTALTRRDCADPDGDDRLDVIYVGTATSNTKWYENMGSLNGGS